MNCRYHKDREAKYICEKCKKPICEECEMDINGRKVCQSCVDYAVFASVPYQHKRGVLKKIFFFFCATIPGAAQMSMGLFKRGLQLMITFIGSIILLTYINLTEVTPLIIMPIWFFSFFDSYTIRKKLDGGEEIQDEEVFDYNFVLKNKKYIGIFVLLLGLIGFINALDTMGIHRIFGLYANMVYLPLRRAIIPIVLISLGIYILYKSKNPESKSA